MVAKHEESKKNPSQINSGLLVILAVVLVITGAAFWFLFLKPAPPQQPGTLTPEAKAYTRNLGLSDVAMGAKESMMQSTLVEITGKISNNGDRALSLVEINCVFYDPYGQIVLRERVPIIKARGPGLKAGETRDFRLPFDSIPQGWNQALPQLVIARIDFGE